MTMHDSLKALALAALLAATVGLAVAEEPQDAAVPPPSAAEETPSPVAAPPAPVKPKLMDINTATREKLMTLPGMSERFADKVIAGRPYRSRVDLKTRNVIPENVFYAILDRIVAKSPKLTAKPTAKPK